MKKLLFTSAILLGGVTLAAAQDAKSQSNKVKAAAPNKTEQTTPAPASATVRSATSSRPKSNTLKSAGAKARPASAMSLFEATSKNQN